MQPRFPSARETATAKAYCNRVGFDVANEAFQVMGGLGLQPGELVEYCVRRCRGWMIAGGSIEISRAVSPRRSSLAAFSQRAGND